MTIIDRYLVRLYVKVLVVCVREPVGLYVVIDGFNNLDEFLTYGKRPRPGSALGRWPSITARGCCGSSTGRRACWRWSRRRSC